MKCVIYLILFKAYTMATSLLSDHNIKPIKLLSLSSEADREPDQLTHNKNTGDLEVLQSYSNNEVYGAFSSPFSLLGSSLEKHVKSDLFIVPPTTDSLQSAYSTAEGLNTNGNKKVQINHKFKDEARACACMCVCVCVCLCVCLCTRVCVCVCGKAQSNYRYTSSVQRQPFHRTRPKHVC